MFFPHILPFSPADLQLLNGCFEFWMTINLVYVSLYIARATAAKIIIDRTYKIESHIVYGSSVELHNLFVNTIISGLRAYS